MNKNLLIIRHGERERLAGALMRSAGLADPGTTEPGLSEYGLKQALALVETIVKQIGESQPDTIPAMGASTILAPTILVSPARRCLQTMAPLAAHFGVASSVQPELAECAVTEAPEAFAARCNDFVEAWLHGQSRLLIACSHHDWIGEVTRIACGESFWLDPAALVWIEAVESPDASGDAPQARVRLFLETQPT